MFPGIPELEKLLIVARSRREERKIPDHPWLSPPKG
jgi:hypothetical protein